MSIPKTALAAAITKYFYESELANQAMDAEFADPPLSPLEEALYELQDMGLACNVELPPSITFIGIRLGSASRSVNIIRHHHRYTEGSIAEQLMLMDTIECSCHRLIADLSDDEFFAMLNPEYDFMDMMEHGYDMVNSTDLHDIDGYEPISINKFHLFETDTAMFDIISQAKLLQKEECQLPLYMRKEDTVHMPQQHKRHHDHLKPQTNGALRSFKRMRSQRNR